MSLLEAKVVLDAGGRQLDADVSLPGGVTALFGPSGAGKTTLLHCLSGLLRPTRGTIRLGGETLFDARRGVNVPVERRGIGYVFQEGRLFPHLTVRANLAYGRRIAARGRRSAAGRAATVDGPRRTGSDGRLPFDLRGVAELLELGPLLDRRPGSLSGGEARRVAIARALLASPRLLLLDEPLAGLDEARKATVLTLLGRIRAEWDVPMLYVSHSLGEILQLTTHVVVLKDGRTIGQGPLTRLLGSGEVFELADSLGLESLLPVTIVETDREAGLTRAKIGEQEVALPPVDRRSGTRALVAIRPEDVILARRPVEGISAQNALRGVVTRVARLPDRLLVTIDVGAPLRAEITARAADRLGIGEGVPVVCLVKAFSFRYRRFDPA